MLLPMKFIPGIRGILDEEEIEKCMENQELTERLRRSLYYGKVPTTDRPSLPVTEIAVEFFQEAAPRELGRVDTFIASNYGRRACMSPCAMMLGMIYIDRLKKRNPEYLRNVSSSDLFLISMMMASKYLYDEGVDEEVFNDEWAESGNMDLDQLNELERNFLKAIDWSLFVKPEEFWRMLHKIERRIAWKKGREHGFFNYTDLLVLTENGLLLKIVKALVAEMGKVLLVCSVAYAAGVVTVFGSTASVLYARQQLPVAAEIRLSLPSWHSLADPVFRSTPLPELGLTRQGLPDTANTATGLHSVRNEESRQHTNKTEANGNTGSKPKMYEPSRKLQLSSSFQLPGLITLVMLKDTVFQFVSGLRSAHSTLGHSKDIPKGQTDFSTDNFNDLEPVTDIVDTENSEDSVICSCGCCGQNSGYDKLCYNLTSSFANLNVPNTAQNGRWNSDRSQLQLGQRHRNVYSDNVNCSPDFVCQCCCAVNPTEDNVRSASNLNWLKSTLSLLRIDEPFAGVTFGFGTSSMAAAAG